ncbi:MAG: oligosaccharide flippase family protein, partial [Pseudomonadota bacterium]
MSGGFVASVGALSAARALAMASQILVLPVMARHLSPAEFGIVALAASIAAFANMFSDAGMGRSLIRTPLERSDEWSSVFWLLAVIGLALTLALLAAAPAASSFFDEPRLTAPLAALAPLPLILSLNAAFAAEMEQRRAFGELALSQVAATVVSLAVALWMAVAGYGVWALVAQQLLLIGLRAVWVVLRSRFRPRLYASRAALGAHFGFGRDVTAASVLGYLGDQSTILVVGKALGAVELGLLSMTLRFARLPMFGLAGPFGQVLYVRLTRTVEDVAAFREVVLASTRLLSFMTLPPMAAIAVVADPAFALILSERWASVAPVFALIAGGAALKAATHSTVVALTALGRTGARLRLTAEITMLWLLMLGAASLHSLEAVAAAQTLWMLVQLPRHWAYLDRACGIGAGAFLSAIAPGVVAAGFVTFAILAAGWLVPVAGWAWLAVAAAAAATAFG